MTVPPPADERAPSPPAAPAAEPGRRVGLDVARAAALLLMIVVNFHLAMRGGALTEAGIEGSILFLGGYPAALFVTLAGVGLSLMADRAGRSGDPGAPRRLRLRLLGRAAFLFAAGLLFVPVWPADILHYFGAYFAVASLLLFAPAAWLWGLAGLATAGFVVLAAVLDYEAGWDFATLTYAGFWSGAGFVRNLCFNGFHPLLPWMAFLLVGMAIGRLDLADAARRRGPLVAALGVWLLAETLSWLVRHPLGDAWGLPEEARILFGRDILPPMPLYVAAAGGASVATILLCLALAARWPSAPGLRTLAATGQMSLTVYLAHVLVGMGALEAFGRLEGQSPAFTAAASLGFCVLALAGCRLWRAAFARGPLEWLMRRLTG